MNERLSPYQTMFLWRLLVSDGEAWLRELRPRLSNPERKFLIGRGFINEQRVSTRNGGRAIYVQLTERAWEWAKETLNDEWPRTSAAAGILNALSKKLGVFLMHYDIPLKEVLAPVAYPQAEQMCENHAAEHQFHLVMLLAACNEIGGGSPSAKVRLAELREKLDLPRQDLDKLLLQLYHNANLLLFPKLENETLTPRDHAAALAIEGIQMYAVSIEKML